VAGGKREKKKGAAKKKDFRKQRAISFASHRQIEREREVGGSQAGSVPLPQHVQKGARKNSLTPKKGHQRADQKANVKEGRQSTGKEGSLVREGFNAAERGWL